MPEIVNQAVEQLAGEIQRSLDFYLATSGDRELTRICLSGGTANIQALQDILQGRTQVPVEVLDPTRVADVDEKASGRPSWPRCTGGGQRGVGPAQRAGASLMIRINLLPTDKKKRARRVAPAAMPTGDLSLQAWGIVYGAAIAVWLVVLGALYFVQSGELETVAQENKTLEARNTELRKKTKGLAEVEARLEKSRRLEQVVQELERARRGPTRAVMELSKVLSNPGGPTINAAELERMREENPLAGYNESWDVRRLWLTRFEEIDRECKIIRHGAVERGRCRVLASFDA